MSFRGREMYKKIVNKLVSKDSTLPSKQIMESVQKLLPNNKLIMNRAKRGLFAGKHIQFGNKVSLQGLNKSKRSWKPNVQEKQLFSYIHDRHIRVKVTTHALRCIDKAGGIDEYLLKTSYNQMDTELGIIWKAKIERMYAELGNTNIGFFSSEQEDKIAKGFEDLKIARKEAKKKKNNVLEEAIQTEEVSTNNLVEAAQ